MLRYQQVDVAETSPPLEARAHALDVTKVEDTDPYKTTAPCHHIAGTQAAREQR